MKTFTDEERCQISEDWLRNGNLKEKARLERVAELNACTPKEVAECLGIEMPKNKRAVQREELTPESAAKAINFKVLEEAVDALLTFVDVFEDVGFLTPEQGRLFAELADQAHHYAAGIRWALERR